MVFTIQGDSSQKNKDSRTGYLGPECHGFAVGVGYQIRLYSGIEDFQNNECDPVKHFCHGKMKDEKIGEVFPNQFASGHDKQNEEVTGQSESQENRVKYQ